MIRQEGAKSVFASKGFLANDFLLAGYTHIYRTYGYASLYILLRRRCTFYQIFFIKLRKIRKFPLEIETRQKIFE